MIYVIISDLHTMSQLNDMFKYADDDNKLLVPEHMISVLILSSITSKPGQPSTASRLI